jgi:hypothetical protein
VETQPPPDPRPDFETASEPVLAGQPVPPPAAAPVIAPPLFPDTPVYRDRGTGLVIFGVFQIILGLLAALMVPLASLGVFMSRLTSGGAIRPREFISVVASYAFIAAVLVTLGIGSVQMKRWARALTLVTSWYGLITGALVTILLTAVLPVTMRSVLAQTRHNTAGGPSPEMSTGIMAVILTLIIIFATFFLVLVPIAFVVFYGRKDVAETVRRRDPTERWTDRTPLPVLGASVALFTGSIYMLLVGLTTPLFPLFGRYLTGIPAAACFAVMAALDAYLAIAIFRLQSSGWWIGVLATSLRLLSMILTYGKADLMQAYSKVGVSDEQLKMLNSSPMLRGHVVLWWGLMSMMLFFGYLLWLRRYFKTPASAREAARPVQVG